MILNRETQKIVDKVAIELGIPKHVATVAYRSFWLHIKDKIESLPNLNTIQEDQFNELKVHFNLPSLGKFTTNFRKVTKANNFKQIINERIKDIKRETLT